VTLQIIIEGRVVFEDAAVYHVLPYSLVCELASKWNLEQIRGAGVQADVAVVIPSIMNTDYYRLANAED
jgi:hypothetical protein